MADVAGIGGRGHARKRARHRTAIAAGKKLPLAQSEKRQLVNPDEKKFRALILVNVAFILAIAEARGRAVLPFDNVFRLVETFVQLARNVATKIIEQRLLEFRKCAAQQKSLRARRFVRLKNRLHQQRFRFSRDPPRRRTGDISRAIRGIAAAWGKARSRDSRTVCFRAWSRSVSGGRARRDD